MALNTCEALPAFGSISSDTCAGATAAIRAAHLQADATMLAGFCTLGAGIFAVVATIYAVYGAREAARIQIRPYIEREKNHQELIGRQQAGRLSKVRLDLVFLKDHLNDERFDFRKKTLSSFLLKAAEAVNFSEAIYWRQSGVPDGMRDKMERLHVMLTEIVNTSDSIDSMMKVYASDSSSTYRPTPLLETLGGFVDSYNNLWDEINELAELAKKEDKILPWYYGYGKGYQKGRDAS